MNKKSQKLYSTLAATALVASAVAPVASAAEEVTVTPTLAKAAVVAENAIGTSGDTIKVTGLTSMTTITVYADSAKTKKIGSTTTTTTVDTVNVEITGGFTTTKVYVTATNAGSSESKALAVSVDKEATVRPAEADLSTINNVTLKDVVKVKNVEGKDKITVYADADKKTKIGSGSVKSGATEVEVKISKGFGDYTKVYVAKTSTGKLESDVTEVAVGTEVSTTFASADTIVVLNNVKLKDQVKVTGLEVKDIVTLYDGSAKAVAKATAKLNKKTNEVEAIITVSKGFDLSKTYTLTKKSANEKESAPLTLTVPEEIASEFTSADTIEVVNNVKLKDQVKVTGLELKDVVVLYDGSAKAVGKATAKLNKKTNEVEAIITVSKGFDPTKTYTLTKTSTNEKESAPKTLEVPEEKVTEFTTSDTIVVLNNVKLKDQVKVTGLELKDVVALYDGGEKPVAKATAKLNKKTNEIEAIITVSKGFDPEKTYTLTKTSTNGKESAKKELEVPAETVTEFTTSDTIVVLNNVKLKDQVKVTGLELKDVVALYDGGEKPVAKATAKLNKKTNEIEAIITVSKGFDPTKTYTLTKTSTNEKESAKKELEVPAEIKTQFTSSDTAIITTTDSAAILTISGAKNKDKVLVYNGSTTIGTATARADGKLEIKLKGEITTSSTIQFTINRYNELVSDKITATFK